jgi:hypothetical protein
MAEMTRTDREELRKVLRAQQKLATEMVDQHAAKLRADGEEQLAKTFSFDDEAFRDLTTAAEAHIRKADKDLAARCTEVRPQLSVSWYSRGENASKERRTELRRVMNTRIDELARAAKVKINARILEGLSLLAADALESSAAKEFLASLPASLPSVEALMPPIDVQALEREADNEKHAGRRPGRLRAID